LKIVGFELEDWERKSFDKLKEQHEVLLTDKAVSENLESQYQDADIISTCIYSNLNKTALEQLNKIKVISIRSTGLNHMDIDYCRTNNIGVSNVPAYGQNTVAEHAFALLLAISRRIPEAVQRTRSGSFSQEGLQGFDLKEKTLGVIGTGYIGKR